jgi:hypothetical protein
MHSRGLVIEESYNLYDGRTDIYIAVTHALLPYWWSLSLVR